MRSYEQLSLDERYQIQTLLKQRTRTIDIARALGRSPSTISREIQRNTVVDATHPYLAARAHKLTHGRRVEKGAAQRKIQGELQEIVESKLRLSWSPEQIAARLRAETNTKLTAETIYQHILRDSKALGFYRYTLRYGGYKHHRFKKSKHAERTKARRNSVHDRPASANDRTELGHWERDTLLGKRGEAALLTLVDRKSRYVRIEYLPKLNAEAAAAGTIQALKGLPLRSMTNDNGVEFQRDEEFQKKLGVKVYFCDPSSPWQRGSVENVNGLARQYVAKGQSLADLTPIAPLAVENTLNFRPRKVLGYKTPYEVMFNKTINLIGDSSMHFGLEFSGGA